MLERLQFSIPINITINAPIDIVWDALTDVQSYPTTLSSVVHVRPIKDPYHEYKSSKNSASTNSSAHRATTEDDAMAGTSTDNSSTDIIGKSFKESRWKITRRSILEHQRYSANVTVTQYSIDCADKKDKRSFTMSSSELLGATCSLRITAEAVPAPPAWYTKARDKVSISKRSLSSSKSTVSEQSQSDDPYAVQVTAILTMIPYQFFIKLLGIMCCLCLLKYRARMAMECDLEDLTTYCEGMKKESAVARTTTATNNMGSIEDRIEDCSANNKGGEGVEEKKVEEI